MEVIYEFWFTREKENIIIRKKNTDGKKGKSQTGIRDYTVTKNQ